jgi:hypothetical protein
LEETKYLLTNHVLQDEISGVTAAASQECLSGAMKRVKCAERNMSAWKKTMKKHQ